MDVFAQIIQAMNDQYGADLDDRDKLEAEKLDLGVRADPTVVEFAKANNFDDFLLEYERIFKGVMLDQEERNGRLYQLLFTNADLLKAWQTMLARELWDEVNDARRVPHIAVETDDLSVSLRRTDGRARIEGASVESEGTGGIVQW